MRTVSNYTLERAQRVEYQEDRAQVQHILKRAELLPDRDRTLVELALRNIGCRRIAQILQMDPGCVSRRLRALGKRLHNPTVIALLDPRCPLPAQLRQMGVERLLTGLTYQQLAHKHELHPVEVKNRLGFLNVWHQAIGARRSL